MSEREAMGCFPENRPDRKSPIDLVLLSFFSIVTVACSLLLSVVISAAAFTRYIIGGDLYGFEEWVKLFAFWLYFMGGAYGAYNDTHVSADVVDSYMKDGTLKRTVIFLWNLITTGISILFTWYGYDFFHVRLHGTPRHRHRDSQDHCLADSALDILPGGLSRSHFHVLLFFHENATQFPGFD